MPILRRSVGPMLKAALVATGAFALSACTTVPVTGRRQLNLMSASTMLSMSTTQYSEFLKTNPPGSNQADAAMVRRVGIRIQSAVERYMSKKKLSDRLSGYKWEYNLVENKEANAWCMPGGKVVVYTGLIPITRDDAGLAVVLGHEIAHAIAEHGAERMSQGLLAQAGGLALSEALKQKPEQTRSLWMGAYGVGAQYGALLPFSRIQESEADHLGLLFMAMAGYDPGTALEFWKRMSEQKGGKGTPEFLSTHPADETRIKQLREEMPEAMKQYKKSQAPAAAAPPDAGRKSPGHHG
jgi:predicted Zn-dependent protease